jgi:MtaA/CmuA family methyltransferase
MKAVPLTDRERMQALVDGEPVDRLPAQPMMMTFAGRFAGIPFGEYCRKGEKMAEAQLTTWRALGTDMLLTCSDPAREVIDLAGEGSVRWFDDQPPAIDEPNAALTDKSRLKTFRMPDLTKPGRMQDRLEAIRILRREAGPGAVVVGWVEGALALAAELRGINAIMLDFYDDPDFVEELFSFCADLSCKYAAAQVEAGADSIGMSDAAASLMGRKFYDQFLWKYQDQILSAIRGAGAMSRLHMCGCTDVLLDKMAELPVDVYEIDFKTDLVKAREALGPEAIICGNIDTLNVMLHGSVERVLDEAESCHRICGDRHVVAPGCETAPLTPVENVRALVEYAAGTGKPIRIGS